ncbi:MAG: hypothetical protein P4M13_10645 [Alphaproteobacteria bacterium]|nr:hypothetical protein [Alphaproteobacteria bacterium]
MANKIRPAETGTQISVRLQAPELAALDAWRKDQPDLPTRPEALRRLAAIALNSNAGKAPARDTVPLADLNASNDE